jgi:thiol-disulfide isomerase/thioredoxin
MRAFLGIWALVMAVATASVMAPAARAQTKEPAKTAGKLIYRDSDGNLVSNNEFVDIRMANFHYPDATIMRTLEDGAVEFRLQKVPQEGMQAPDFSLSVIGGPRVTLSSLRGKVVVLSFWFIGCPACRALKPHLNEFKARFADRDDIVFLAVTADPEGRVREYLKKEPFDYLQGTDAADALGMFKFGGYPKNIVISKTGEIVYWRSTIKAWDKFKSVVDAELTK